MGEIDLSSIQADNVVDARGVSCPGPLLEAKKGMGMFRWVRLLEILSNDPGSKERYPQMGQKGGP
jgi:tRNA 2-thiouridine synthesizing protein A